VIFSSRGELWRYPFPLPLFSYRYLRRGFFMSLGLPLVMLWKPHEKITMVLTGMLPLVGSLRFSFRLHRYVSLSLEWHRRKESYYLTGYPFHDWRYGEYFLKRTFHYMYTDDQLKKFVMETQRTGATISFNYDEYFSIFIYNGYQFASSYYRTDNILARPKNPDRIANSYQVQAGVRGCLAFGGESE
jgi:hypothetical protein